MTTFEHHLGQGEIFLGLEQVDEALREFLAALELKPEDATTLERVADLFVKKESFDKALPNYEKLIALHPERADIWANLGRVHLELGDGQRALDGFERSRLLDEDNKSLDKYRGLAHASLGNYKDAQDCFLRAGETAKAEEMAQHISLGYEVVSSESVLPDEFVDVDLETNPGLAMPSSNRGIISGLPEARLASELLKPGLSIEQVESGIVLCRTEGSGCFVRRASVLSTVGKIEFQTAHRRSRGSGSEEELGGEQPIVMAEGGGSILLGGYIGTNGEELTTIEVENEHIYFREEVVMAFDATLRYENGNVPGRELEVIQFRGDGRVVFCHPRSWVSLSVSEEQPVSVKASSLLGWSHKLVPKAEADDSETILCSGEGTVFVGGNFLGKGFFDDELFGEVKEKRE